MPIVPAMIINEGLCLRAIKRSSDDRDQVRVAVFDEGTAAIPADLASGRTHVVKITPEQVKRLSDTYMAKLEAAALAWDAGGTDELKIDLAGADGDDGRMLREIVEALYPSRLLAYAP